MIAIGSRRRGTGSKKRRATMRKTGTKPTHTRNTAVITYSPSTHTLQMRGDTTRGRRIATRVDRKLVNEVQRASAGADAVKGTTVCDQALARVALIHGRPRKIYLPAFSVIKIKSSHV